MHRRFIFEELAVLPKLEEPLLLEYISDGMLVMEEHVVPLHWPTIRLQRALYKSIDDGLERLKGKLIDLRV